MQGHEVERLNAQKNIKANFRKTAVLDLSALITASKLNAFDVLHGFFEHIFIPRSILESLKYYKERLAKRKEHEQATMILHDGNLVWIDDDPDLIDDEVNFLNALIDKSEKYLFEGAIAVKEDYYLDTKNIMSALDGENIFDVILLSVNLDALVISEDLRYSEMVNALFNGKATWLQEVFREAFILGQIELSVYSDLVVGLARLKHGHVSIDANTLSNIANRDQEQFDIAIQYIGNEQADLKSHLHVIIEFIKINWAEKYANPIVCACTSKLLRNITRFNSGAATEILATIKRHTRVYRGFQEYIKTWMLGHFFLNK